MRSILITAPMLIAGIAIVTSARRNNYPCRRVVAVRPVFARAADIALRVRTLGRSTMSVHFGRRKEPKSHRGNIRSRTEGTVPQIARAQGNINEGAAHRAIAEVEGRSGRGSYQAHRRRGGRTCNGRNHPQKDSGFPDRRYPERRGATKKVGLVGLG